MREIRLGLEQRLDVSVYAKELYRWQQMREIRLGLEEGLDVSAYMSMMYSAKDMEQIRKQMKKKQADDKRQEEERISENFQFEVLEEQAKLASECLITVNSNKMEAYVTLEKGSCKSKDDILRLLEKNNVIFGIRHDNIEKYLKEADKSTNRFLVAEGISPERGKDGYYEFFFRTGIPQIPAIRKDGSVEIPAHGGQEKQILRGRGFLLSPDKKTYLARESGKIELKDNKIIIQPLMVVDEVTISTGNLRFNGSIWVRGNVGSGVVFRAAAEFVVEGNVDRRLLFPAAKERLSEEMRRQYIKLKRIISETVQGF